MPTGKANTFANQTVPDLILITIRKSRPVSLVGAFEEPVVPGEHGYVSESISRLDSYQCSLETNFDLSPERAWFVGTKSSDRELTLGEQVTFDELLTQLDQSVREFLEDA